MKRKFEETLVPSVIHDFRVAEDFVKKNHPDDLKWIISRQKLVETFEKFFAEYVYVVIASGFRAATAAKLTPKLIECKGDYEKMIEIFGNKSKCKSISDVYNKYHGKQQEWENFRDSLETEDDLMKLPRIGPVVKFHLARNIGLNSDIVKPDVHMVRYTKEYGVEDPKELVEFVKETFGGYTLGTIDFIFWVWLSHKKGEKEQKCCTDNLPIR